jgi:hypothetical protein
MRFGVLVLALLCASSANASEHCWHQPTQAEPITGFVFKVGGVHFPATITDEGPLEVGGVPGQKWCATAPFTGTYNWTVGAIMGEFGVVESETQTRYVSVPCRADLNDDGAVGVNDVNAVLALLGQVCTAP